IYYPPPTNRHSLLSCQGPHEGAEPRLGPLPGRRRGLLFEAQFPSRFIHVDANDVADFDLSGGDQVRQRYHQVALDDALERARAVTSVEAFGEQEILCPFSATEHEISASRQQDAALYDLEFDVQDPAQRFLGERMEDHDLVETVDEFRREFAARRLDSDLFYPRVEFRPRFKSARKSELAFGDFGHFTRAQI